MLGVHAHYPYPSGEACCGTEVGTVMDGVIDGPPLNSTVKGNNTFAYLMVAGHDDALLRLARTG